jgi:hypothetical protein
MEAEVTHFYLTNYIDSFSTPDVDLAYAQIPQVGAQHAQHALHSAAQRPMLQPAPQRLQTGTLHCLLPALPLT